MKAERSEVVDLFKAFACVFIVWHHLAFYGPMSDVVSEWVPAFIAWLYDHGRLAVQVFLVLGGYLSAKSWMRSLAQEDFQFLPRVWARYQRLVIPLMAALSFTVAMTAVVRPFFEHASLSDAPSFLQALAHVFLLQDVLYLEAFSAGVWYVAIDFQLFTIALGCAVLAHRWQSITGRGSVVRKVFVMWLALTLGSLFFWNLHPSGDIWGTYFFSAYGLGLCVGSWRLTGFKFKHPSLALLLFMLGLFAWMQQPRLRLVIAFVVAVLLSLYEAGDCKPLPWLKAKWIKALSSASYAIFLIHFGVSLGVSTVVYHFWSESLVVNALGMLTSFVLSLVMGRLLFMTVENKPATVKHFLQWVATFAATCTAVMLLG